MIKGHVSGTDGDRLPKLGARESPLHWGPWRCRGAGLLGARNQGTGFKVPAGP